MLKLPFSTPNDIKVGPRNPYDYWSFVGAERPKSAPCKYERDISHLPSWNSGNKSLHASPGISLHQQDKENEWQLRSSPLPLTPLTSDPTMCCFSGSPRELQLVVDDNGKADMQERPPSYETDQYLNLGSAGQTISSVDITVLDSPGYIRKCPSVANCEICNGRLFQRDEDGSAEQAMLKSFGVVPSEIFKLTSEYNSFRQTSESHLSIDRDTDFFSSTRVTESDEDIFSFGSISKRSRHSSSGRLLSSDIGPYNSWYEMQCEYTQSPGDEYENVSDSDHTEASIDTISPSELEIYPTKCNSGAEMLDCRFVENEFDYQKHSVENESDHQKHSGKNMETGESLEQSSKSAIPNKKRKRNMHHFSEKTQTGYEKCRHDLVYELLEKYPSTKGWISGVICCKWSYSNATELAQHFDKMHDEKFRRTYVCQEPHCVYSVLGFTSKQELSRHISSAHSPPRYYCDICFTNGHERTFRRGDSLNRHINVTHSSNESE